MSDLIWYLAHPVNGDDQFDLRENVWHTKRCLSALWREGVRAVAPWFAHVDMFVQNGTNNYFIPDREECLGLDCRMVRLIGRVILTGHRISDGMQREIDSLSEFVAEAGVDPTQARLIDLTGVPSTQFSSHIALLRKHGVSI